MFSTERGHPVRQRAQHAQHWWSFNSRRP